MRLQRILEAVQRHIDDHDILGIIGEIRALIRLLAEKNADWGAPKVHGELLKLGFDVSEMLPLPCRKLRS